MTIRFDYGGPRSQTFAGGGDVAMHVNQSDFYTKAPVVVLTYTTGLGTMRNTDHYVKIHPEDFEAVISQMMKADRKATVAAFKAANAQ